MTANAANCNHNCNQNMHALLAAVAVRGPSAQLTVMAFSSTDGSRSHGR